VWAESRIEVYRNPERTLKNTFFSGRTNNMERAPYVFKDTGDFQENQGKNNGNLYISPSQRLREETLTSPLRTPVIDNRKEVLWCNFGAVLM
jgi:hypothetical protein